MGFERFVSSEVSRRQLMAGAAAAASMACAPDLLAAALTVEDAKLAALFDRIYAKMLAYSPEMASFRGESTPVARARLDDRSVAGEQARIAMWKASIAELKAIDRGALSPARATQFDIATEALANRVRVREAYSYGDDSFFLYRLTQFTGSYAAVPELLDRIQVVKTEADAEAYLARLGAFATALDQETGRQDADARSGIIAPDFVLDLVLANLQRLRDPANARTELAEPLRVKTAAGGLKDRSAAAWSIIEKAVIPALDRQIAATEALRKSATNVPGAWRLPDGDAFYADAFRHMTTSSMSPAEAHEVGLEKVRELEGRLGPLLAKAGYSKGTVAEQIEQLKSDPAQYYSNDDAGRAALLAFFVEDTARVKAALPKAFARLPKGDVEIRRMPLSIEGLGPAAAAIAGSADGSRKAAVIVDLKDMKKWPKFSLKTLCRHEGIPGHHIQNAMAQESPDAPKLLGMFPNSAYGEGWALYSEQLTHEMGLYDGDPMSEIGMWQSLLFRAARIVVDTGIHFKRWSRQQAVDYMVKTTAMTRAMMESEVNRYAIIPGQACSYMLGHIEWMRARENVRQQVGPKFDLGRFHNVLLDGPMPMSMLERHALARVTAA